jgi:dCMP deaminase
MYCNNLKRPDWNSYFMNITLLTARRSTCLHKQLGAIAVRDKRILSTGYNGAPSGLKHCLDTGYLREQKKYSGRRKT